MKMTDIVAYGLIFTFVVGLLFCQWYSDRESQKCFGKSNIGILEDAIGVEAMRNCGISNVAITPDDAEFIWSPFEGRFVKREVIK